MMLTACIKYFLVVQSVSATCNENEPGCKVSSRPKELLMVQRFAERKVEQGLTPRKVEDLQANAKTLTRREISGDCFAGEIPEEHTTYYREPGARSCTPLNINLDRNEGHATQMEYCSNEVGNEWFDFADEALVAYTIIHPRRAHPNNSLFLDVGANAGIYSLLALDLGYTVVSFEPQPVCVDDILHMQKKLGSPKRWHLFHTGVGCKPANLQVFGDMCKMNWQLESAGPGTRRNYDIQSIPLTTFAPFLEGMTSPPFIKVDVDGGEIEVAKAIMEIAMHSQVLPEMYVEINVLNWPNQNVDDEVHEGVEVFSQLGKMYNEAFLFVRSSPDHVACQDVSGVPAKLSYFKTIVSSSNSSMWKMLDYEGVLRACHQAGKQLNVYYAA